MIARALLLALWATYAAALAPLSIPADDDCALYLTGPGRSSAYDYSLNLLKGNFGYDGQHSCITYDAVNQAYLDARNRILVAQPKGEWKPEDFASVGELILDISIQLARTYGLTYEEIEKGLPLIDTSRTLIREACPPVFSHVECRAGKYRRLDGLCNNLQHPTWGATMAPFQRLIGPLFSDGINAPRISHTGRDLPLSRVVSRTMHPDDGFHDHAGTVMVIAWGQFMDHDYTLTGTPLDPVHRNDPEECCKRPPHLKHPYCNEIRIPDDDYFYRLFGVKCIDFVRGFPSPRPGCRLGSRNPFNTLTGAIDGNTVYGVTDKFSRKLRTGYGGLLRMNPVFKEYGLKDLLPLKLDIPDEGCTRPNKNMYCFEAGEIRVNEQLVLTVMHTLMAREHNRVAEGLASVNPHWDDETLFQEARRINIAEIQHITYNEFLPILLGKDVMEKFGLVLEKQGYWNGYDQEVNPDVIASFAAAAYRFGHSLLPTAVERWSKAHKFIASKRLSDLIRRPYDLYRAGVLDEYVMGLMNQVAQAMDDSITQEVTNHLFKKVGARFGMDLVSFNMQRGREFGLPGYMEFRKFCGLSGADTFDELFGSMPNETVRKYETIFEHPIDVDLWSGGVSERPLPGSMLGPTFACIIATQFSYSRRGDRFWFELPHQPSSFTPEQLSEIRKSRLARVICDNTDIIDTVQLYPMVLPDHELNPRVPCRSGIIPQMDFSKWADPVPFHGAAKQFITVAVVSSNQNQNITFIETPHNATDIKGLENTTSGQINDKEFILTLKEEIIELPDKDGHNLKDMSAGDDPDTQTVLKEQSNIESDIRHNRNNDTLLKYIYKKHEKENVTQKSKGHFQNSLKRRKRFINSSDSDIDPRPKSLPVPIDYIDTEQGKLKDELFLPVTRTGGIVQSSNLADFNIETIHIDEAKHVTDVHNKENNHPKPVVNAKNYPSLQNDENNAESVESVERNENKYRLEKKPKNKDSGENRSISDENSSSYEGEHSVETPNTSFSSEYNKERKEPEKYRDNENPILHNKDQSNENQENDKSYESSSIENSREAKKEYTEKSIEFHGNNSSNENNPLIVPKKDYINLEIEKGDGGEFPKMSREKHTKDDTVESLESLATPKISEEVSSESKSEESKEIYTDSRSKEESKDNKSERQTRINDEEVKPVVELNNGSFESSEEISEEDENLKNNSKLVSLTNVKNSDSKQKDISAKSDSLEKVDVKQQFERIPLDYNHVNEANKNNTSNSTALHVKPTEISSEEKDKEGTIDTLSPINPINDDEFNIKFHDVPVKLPEIKLPEDILSYAYEGPYYDTKKRKDKDDQKQKFYYNYEADDLDQNPKEKYSKEDDFYDYYKNDKEYDNVKRNSKLKNEDEDNEDLYEKFVRERFGKKTVKQKSEKIQDEPLPSQLKLRKTLKNILKKTENVKKEAEKSGDPNANYMWTLEYGENI